MHMCLWATQVSWGFKGSTQESLLSLDSGRVAGTEDSRGVDWSTAHSGSRGDVCAARAQRQEEARQDSQGSGSRNRGS